MQKQDKEIMEVTKEELSLLINDLPEGSMLRIEIGDGVEDA